MENANIHEVNLKMGFAVAMHSGLREQYVKSLGVSALTTNPSRTGLNPLNLNPV